LRAAKTKTLCPDDFSPTDKDRLKALTFLGSHQAVDEVAEGMRDWSHGKGIKREDWDATFRTCVRLEVQRRGRGTHTRKLAASDQLREEWDLPSFKTPEGTKLQ
jgi:hypothetical protein